jgi:hypothetical protein
LHHMVLQTMTNSEDGGNIFLQNIGNHTQYWHHNPKDDTLLLIPYAYQCVVTSVYNTY